MEAYYTANTVALPRKKTIGLCLAGTWLNSSVDGKKFWKISVRGGFEKVTLFVFEALTG